MATTLLAKLRTAAALDATLGPLLGPTPFRWYDQQLNEGTSFPAVAAFVVSTVPQYATNARCITARYRVQFNVFDPNPQKARQVATAIAAFLDSFNAFSSGSPVTQQPNQVVNQRDGGVAQTQPLTAMQIIDAHIWNNETT